MEKPISFELMKLHLDPGPEDPRTRACDCGCHGAASPAQKSADSEDPLKLGVCAN